MKKIFVFFIAILATFTSCVITQEYDFNKDFSGTAKTSIDFTQLKMLMAGIDTTEKSSKAIDSLDVVMAYFADSLKIVGAKNVNIQWNDDKTIIELSYNFKNIEILNKSLKINDKLGLSQGRQKPHFELSGWWNKKLSFIVPEFAKNDTSNSAKSKYEEMDEMLKYNIKFRFASKVKKINNKNYVLNADKKGFAISVKMSKMTSPDFHAGFKAKIGR